MGDRREPEPEHESDPASRSAADVSDALGLRSAGNLGPSEPHVVVTTEAPELTGASYTFTTLPDGSLIVDDSCNEDLSRLADAVKAHLPAIAFQIDVHRLASRLPNPVMPKEIQDQLLLIRGPFLTHGVLHQPFQILFQLI